MKIFRESSQNTYIGSDTHHKEAHDLFIDFEDHRHHQREVESLLVCLICTAAKITNHSAPLNHVVYQRAISTYPRWKPRYIYVVLLVEAELILINIDCKALHVL